MDTAMSYQEKTESKAEVLKRVPRQGELDLTGEDRWRQFPGDDREACRQVLAELFYEVITNQSAIHSHER